jgi:hypothetical protein
MAETDKTLVSTHDAFKAARGEDLDKMWAFAVGWRLCMKEVEIDLVREGLEEVLAMVRETQEGPEDLFGTPDEYAPELYERWRSEGRLPPSHTVMPPARSIPASSLRAGGWIALLMFVLTLFDAAGPTIGILLVPVALGFGSVGGIALWEWASRRWPTPLAAAFMATVVIAFAFGFAALLTTIETSLGRATPWLLLLEAAVLTFVGRAALGLVTAKAYVAARDGLDDEQWVERFSGIMRGPGWTRESRVRELVAEARSHATESGRTLAEEFGPPEHYASQLGADAERRIRLRIAFVSLLTLLVAVQLIDGWSWTTIAMLVLLAWKIWADWQKYRAVRAASA